MTVEGVVKRRERATTEGSCQHLHSRGLRCANFPDDRRHGLRRLGSRLDPLVHLLLINLVVHPLHERVIGAELLNIRTVASLVAIHNNDLVVRAILGALAVETN